MYRDLIHSLVYAHAISLGVSLTHVTRSSEIPPSSTFTIIYPTTFALPPSLAPFVPNVATKKPSSPPPMLLGPDGRPPWNSSTSRIPPTTSSTSNVNTGGSHNLDNSSNYTTNNKPIRRSSILRRASLNGAVRNETDAGFQRITAGGPSSHIYSKCYMNDEMGSEDTKNDTTVPHDHGLHRRGRRRSSLGMTTKTMLPTETMLAKTATCGSIDIVNKGSDDCDISNGEEEKGADDDNEGETCVVTSGMLGQLSPGAKRDAEKALLEECSGEYYLFSGDDTKQGETATLWPQGFFHVSGTSYSGPVFPCIDPFSTDVRL